MLSIAQAVQNIDFSSLNVKTSNETGSAEDVGSENILTKLNEALKINKLIFNDENSKIWLNLKFDIYTRPSNSTVIEQVGTVDHNGLTSFDSNELNKLKRHFRIGIVEGIPWTYKKVDPISKRFEFDEKNQPIYDGYCIDFIKALATELNFSYDLVLPTTGTFGELTTDGTFDGAIGDLVTGEIDMIVAALKMTAEREEVIDFVAPYFEQTGISIVMKKPTPDRSLFKFMTVLRLEVWLSICGAIITTALVLWILEILSPYSARNHHYNEEFR